MSSAIHAREFSRSTFLKGGGALVIGFSVGAAIARSAGAANTPVLTSSLVISGNNNPAPWAPDPNALDSWIAVHRDNTVSLMTCKCEVGGGQMTSLVAIVAEELSVGVDQVKFVTATTKQVNAGSTGGSSTTPRVGRFVRAAGATAAQTLLSMASTKLGVPVANLTVSKGVVSGGGRSVSYGDLVGDQLFNVQMPASYGMTPANVAARPANLGLANGQAPAKPVSQYTIVGTSVPRIDLPAKIAGSYTYVHNIRVPGMLHGRVVMPRGQTSYGVTVPIVSVDKQSIAHIPGAQVVQRNNFLGVVAPAEYDAIRAASQLKVKWADTPQALPTTGNLFKQMRDQDTAGLALTRFVTNTGNVDAALASAAKVVSGTYSWEYTSRAVIGPACAIADVKNDSALILSNSKNPHDTLNTVAAALGLPPTKVEVRFFEGSSDYGWANYNDTINAAALMSQEIGKPVRVQFMRWDEHGYDNYGPPHLIDIRAGIDAKGNLVAWDGATFGIPYYFYGPGDSVMQALGTKLPTDVHPSSPTPGTNTVAQYQIPSVRVLSKALPIINSGYVKSSYLRTPRRTGHIFASEQVIDQLAYEARMDPIAFRIQNLGPTDKDRLLAVIEEVSRLANWKPRVAASSLSDAEVVTGRGVGVVPSSSSLLAAIADIEVNKKTGKITPKHVYIGIDAGLAVNPTGVKRQVIGGAVQAISWTLIEQVPFNKQRVTGLDWVSYPILRFKDAPKVTAFVIQRPELPTTGAGEESQPATIGAIANAFFDATGVRVHAAPMTPARVRGALQQAGKA